LQIFTPLILFGFLLSIATAKHFLTKLKEEKRTNLQFTASPFERALSVFLFLVTSLFTFIVSIAFSPFRCSLQVDGSYTLISKPSEECFNSQWFSHFWLILIALLFLLFFPVILFLKLRSFKGRFQSNAFVWRYGLLTHVYKEKYYYWELLSMLRKTVIVIIIDLFSDFSVTMRYFVLVTFLVVWLSIESWVEPFRHEGFSTIVAYL
jgi:hypothetical protein